MSNLFDTGIRPIVDAHLQAEAEKVRDYGEFWSASSAGYCMRKLIFERLGVEQTNPFDARKHRVFSAGHIFHDWLQELTRNAGISIAQELELIDDDLKIRGHFDDLVLVPTGRYILETGEVTLLTDYKPGEIITFKKTAPKTERGLILYDYKTQNSRAFTYQKQSGREMSHYHKYQLATYMYMLRTQPLVIDGVNTKDLNDSRILLLSKDDLRMDEHQLLWTDELGKEIKDWWTELNRYWTEKKMPPCTCADHEGGFMAKEKFNPYWYNGEPCSLEYYKLWKAKK